MMRATRQVLKRDQFAKLVMHIATNRAALETEQFRSLAVFAKELVKRVDPTIPPLTRKQIQTLIQQTNLKLTTFKAHTGQEKLRQAFGARVRGMAELAARIRALEKWAIDLSTLLQHPIPSAVVDPEVKQQIQDYSDAIVQLSLHRSHSETESKSSEHLP